MRGKHSDGRKRSMNAFLTSMGFLRRPSAFLVTVGYAYGDDHLNEVVFQGLRSNPSAAAFGLLYKDLANEPAAMSLSNRVPMNLSLLAKDRGVVRMKVDEWVSGSAGTGKAAIASNDLGDFAVFAAFVKSFVPAKGA